MGRPKGSKNKAKNRPVVGTQNGGTDAPSQPNASPAQDEVATAETLARGPAQEGGETAPPAVGDTVTHPDGRTGEVTEVEARGAGHAVSVRWAGDDDDSQYTPTDWRELQAALVAAHAPTEPAYARSIDDIGHDMAEAQAQLDELERDKAAIVKDYGKRIGTAAHRVSELAAEYRQAERRDEVDYDLGVVRIYNKRTGELLATRPLADSERQQVLPLDHPVAPPSAEDSSGQPDEDDEDNPASDADEEP